jgi:putative flippase GtrA
MLRAPMETTQVLAARARDAYFVEPVRYLVASLAALLLDAGLLWAGVEKFGAPVWLAGAIGYLGGLILIYGLSVRWVFARRAVREPLREFAVFAALGLVGLVANSITLEAMTMLAFPLYGAKIVSAGVGFSLNFALRKLLLFSVRKR